MKKKTGKVVAVVLVTALSVLSVNSLLFSVRLFRFLWISSFNDEKEMDILAKNLLINKRLSSLAEEKYLGNDRFLASFMAELIADNTVHLLREKYKGYSNYVFETFPENIFLAHFGLYEGKDPAKDWEDFDTLSLKLLREPQFNTLTFPLLTGNITEGYIPDSSLPQLILYLSWMENFSLAEDLLSWASEKKKIGDGVYDALVKDLFQRKKSRPETKIGPGEEPEVDSFIFSFENKEVRIEAGRNLIADRNFKEGDSIKKKWTFSETPGSGPYTKGSFYGHIDNLENCRLRLMGFFTETFEGTGLAYGGLRLKKKIRLSEDMYLFHFKYKTSGRSEIPCFRLTEDANRAFRLEPADTDWKDVFFVLNNNHYKLAYVQPLLGMFGTGSVWLENIGFYRIEVEGITVEQDVLVIQ